MDRSAEGLQVAVVLVVLGAAALAVASEARLVEAGWAGLDSFQWGPLAARSSGTS